MNADFLDLLTSLCAAEARFLVVGAYAVGVHGRPRATKDLDVWIEASPDNARRVLKALRDFGAPLGDLTHRDFETPGTGFTMGEPPTRVDILTQIEAFGSQTRGPDDSRRRSGPSRAPSSGGTTCSRTNGPPVDLRILRTWTRWSA